MSTLLYTHSKDDLERIVRKVINEIRKTELTSETVTPEEDRLSQKEAAAFLGVSVVTLISWVKKGLVPRYQIEQSIFYSKNELLEIARKNRNLVKA